MARYIGGAVGVAAIAMIYNAVTNNHQDAGESASEALAAGVGAASLALAICLRRGDRARRSCCAATARRTPAQSTCRGRRVGRARSRSEPTAAVDGARGRMKGALHAR